MRPVIWKNIFREIKSTLNRFVAIFAIVALGVGFFAGLKATMPDMQQTAEQYYDEQGLMDLRLLSTFGFTEDDVTAISELDGVELVLPTYSTDVLSENSTGEVVIKAYAMPGRGINELVLLEGRLPENSGECVIESSQLSASDWEIGDTVSFSDGNSEETLEQFETTEYTVVGVVRSPLYISFERGNSSIGNGQVSCYVFLPQEDFASEYYTDLYLTLAGAEELSSFQEEYNDLVSERQEALENLGEERVQLRYDEIVTEAAETLEDAKKELAEKTKEADDALQEAEQLLTDVKTEIEDGKTALIESAQQLESGEAELLAQKEGFQQQSDDAHAQIAAGRTQLSEEARTLSQGKEQLQSGKEQLSALRIHMEQLIAAGQAEEAEALQAQAAAMEAELAATEAALLQGEQVLAASMMELEQQEAALLLGEQQAQEGFAEAGQAISDGWNQYADGQQALADAQIQYDEGKIEYAQTKADTLAKLEEAKYEIEDGERELRTLKKPQWYVLDRNNNPGYEGYVQDTQRVDAIAAVFPVFFFAIAALVCLTSMTRMVEEQRTQIGTLKALGYGKGAIAAKYLIYAALASVLGSAVGLLVGFQVFPRVIWKAYQMMYQLPEMRPQFHVLYAIISSGAAVLCTGIATLSACIHELNAVPAQLMRPKAPKPGKRIWLERIPFLWKRMSFTGKVTARNLFRYKQRFLMTVIGISGCAAMMLTGFGLRDSIMGIGKKQFEDIFQYDVIATLAEASDKEEDSKLNDILGKSMEESVYTMQMSIDVVGESTMSATLFVPEEPSRIERFIELRERIGKKPVSFPTDGSVILTEKIAKELGVRAGDTVTLQKSATEQGEAVVAGVVENYIYNFVYLDPDAYEAMFGEAPEYRQVISRLPEGEAQRSQEEEDELAERLLKIGNVQGVTFTTGIGEQFEDVLQSLNAIVYVLIICANLLAFIVLYNLTNINITERMREIATIKVLGFFDKEVSSYVYRENAILTVIGTGVGMVLGIFLHQFVIQTAEVNMVMFERTIHGESYLYATILTFLFAALVNFVMYFRLKKISMVESLKSVE